MVLTPVRSRLLLALLWVGFAGCIKPKPTPRLAQPAEVRAVYVMTYADRPDVTGVPDSVSDAISTALGARNLQPQPADIDALTTPYERKRTTQDRLELLAAQATGEPFVLLVEATPRYYSLLSGRYRWDVKLRATIAPTGALSEAHSEDWQLSAFLDFGHQDHVDALDYSAQPIADRVARLTDRFLTGYDGASLARAPSREPADDDRAPHPLDPGAAIYFVMVDRFHNADLANDGEVDLDDPHAFHGGDLQGVTAKLDWLQDLGITSIWLSPIFEMRTEKFHGHGAFHGYWVDDFGAIEPRLGGEPALEELRGALADRDMSLFLDMVLNHVAMDHELVTQKPDWFHNRGGITDWNDPEQVVYHDVHGLPDLAQSNPEVYAHLLDHSLKWLAAAQPAGFRLDAVKHISTDFWTKYNADIKAEAGDDFVMLGEDLDGDPARVAQTMRTGKFDAMFDFPLHFALVDVFCRDAHPGRLAATLFADRLYPASVGERREGLVTLLDNHDLPRILSACGNDEQRVLNALRFMLTARGTPSFTWGTESGAQGATEPDNRADMRFDEHPIGTAMREWLAHRRTTQPLTHGRDVLLALGPTSLVYARVTADETVAVALNTTQSEMKLDLPDAEWRNVDTGAKFRAPLAPPGVSAWSAPINLPIPAHNVDVEFRIKDAPEGELRIAGSGPELGNWDPLKAPTAGAVRLPRGGAFAYKPVVLTDGGPQWADGDNRFVLVGRDQIVNASFR